MVWQVPETLKLINLYRNTPEMWNPEHADYKNKNARKTALMKLADQMHTSCIEIEKKLRGIRTQFAREHIRELSGQRSIWFGYQPLSFLAKGKKCIFMDESQTEPWTEFENIDEIEFVTPEESDVGSTVSTVDEKIKILDSESISVIATKRPSDSVRSVCKKCKRSSSSDRDQAQVINDEYTAFANCVVHKLQNIKNAKVRSIAQYYINSVLFQAEMTNYDDDFEFDRPKEFNLFRKTAAANTE